MVYVGAPVSRLEHALSEHGIGAVALERMLWHSPTVHLSREIVIGLGNVESLDIPAKVVALDNAIGSV